MRPQRVTIQFETGDARGSRGAAGGVERNRGKRGFARPSASCCGKPATSNCPRMRLWTATYATLNPGRRAGTVGRSLSCPVTFRTAGALRGHLRRGVAGSMVKRRTGAERQRAGSRPLPIPITESRRSRGTTPFPIDKIATRGRRGHRGDRRVSDRNRGLVSLGSKGGYVIAAPSRRGRLVRGRTSRPRSNTPSPPLLGPSQNGERRFGRALARVRRVGVRRPFGRRPSHRTWCRSAVRRSRVPTRGRSSFTK